MIIPPGEKIIETKKCRISGLEFFITDKDLEFYDTVSPIFGWKKYQIPPPTLSPHERQRRRFSWRNERRLYKRKCDKSWKEIISLYSAEKEFPVYDQSIWWGDDWSSIDYGINFDFSRNFFDQFGDMAKRVPLPATLGKNLENSDYSLHSADLKNCYLIVSTISGEDLLYGYQGNGSKNCIDFYQTHDSQYCYQVVDVHRSYNCFFSQDLDDCRNCIFCYDCKNCTDCLFCFNLRGKAFCINNKQLTAEEYFKEKQKISLSNHLPQLREKWRGMWLRVAHRAIHGIKNENCIWDYLNSCSDCMFCFDYSEWEKFKYVTTGRWGKNTMDSDYVTWDWCHECLSPAFGVNEVLFSAFPWWSSGSLYLHYCQSCTNCFWNISLKHQKHCILNKPYSVQEYESLCWKIIDHMRSTNEWWEFFPHALSPFWYNETVAQEYYPLTEVEVKKRWWKWHHTPENTFAWKTIIPLPIEQYNEKQFGYEIAQGNIDMLLNWTIQCEITGRPFKIIKQELVFYIENSLPIPLKHPDQRHKERMDLRNPRTLFERTCSECHKNIISSYSPERPERVLCEECYRKLVY